MAAGIERAPERRANLISSDLGEGKPNFGFVVPTQDPVHALEPLHQRRVIEIPREHSAAIHLVSPLMERTPAIFIVEMESSLVFGAHHRA